ncbi:MAG TPA: hypothetical protein VN643_10945 [Pyrinomonadaceae bacterium]|nr:hypothetical protein [Pyrinomonadaceae bacterium]
MNKKCPKCGFVTWAGAEICKRCGAALGAPGQATPPTVSEGKSSTRPPKEDIRRDALKKMKYGGVATVLYVGSLVLVVFGYLKIKFNPFYLAFGLAPVGWFLAGILQMVTGVPFTELSDKWDALAGWQRGVIGISVFIGGLIVLFLVCMIILFVLQPEAFIGP